MQIKPTGLKVQDVLELLEYRQKNMGGEYSPPILTRYYMKLSVLITKILTSAHEFW